MSYTVYLESQKNTQEKDFILQLMRDVVGPPFSVIFQETKNLTDKYITILNFTYCMMLKSLK